MAYTANSPLFNWDAALVTVPTLQEVHFAMYSLLYFFSHGLRHLPTGAIERINRLELGEKLCLQSEFQNSYDSQTLILNTKDHHNVGYCPRYLLAEIQLLRHNSNLEVFVEHVNKPQTPLKFRLLCKISVDVSDNFRPFSGFQYQPLISEIATAIKST